MLSIFHGIQLYQIIFCSCCSCSGFCALTCYLQADNLYFILKQFAKRLPLNLIIYINGFYFDIHNIYSQNSSQNYLIFDKSNNSIITMIQKSITKTFALENCLQTLAYSLKNVKYIQRAKGQITLSSKKNKTCLVISITMKKKSTTLLSMYEI